MAALICLVCFAVSASLAAGVQEEPSAAVREPAVAGRFYPADPAKLRAAVKYFLENARAPSGVRPIALVVPHAGYVYSGQIAADAFKQAEGFDFDVVVLLGTNHTTPGFFKISVYPAGGYRTPLGTVQIDTQLADSLIKAERDVTFNPLVHSGEHSVEVQLPFVQTLFPEAKILPVVIGVPEPGLCRRFGKALAERLRGRRALVVASSDLSHYPTYSDALKVDRETLNSLTRVHFQSVERAFLRPIDSGISNLGTYACGAAPVLAAVAAAAELGAVDSMIVSYANSGDTVVGSRDRVVGYGAVVMAAEELPESRLPGLEAGGEDSREIELSEEERKSLLAFARRTILQYLESDTVPSARHFGRLGAVSCGVFVTLRKQGVLRGCVGDLEGQLPLGQGVGRCALRAALNDPRFPPVGLEELKDTEIEISVLTARKAVRRHTEIQIGTDGIVLEKRGRSAVFLPSVAIEEGWNLEETLDYLCVKAGLPPGSWKEGARLYTFQALAFRESD